MLLLSKQAVVRDDDSEVWLLGEITHRVRVRVSVRFWLSLDVFVALRVTDTIKG